MERNKGKRNGKDGGCSNSHQACKPLKKGEKKITSSGTVGLQAQLFLVL
jgi:hypothetical protein